MHKIRYLSYILGQANFFFYNQFSTVIELIFFVWKNNYKKILVPKLIFLHGESLFKFSGRNRILFFLPKNNLHLFCVPTLGSFWIKTTLILKCRACDPWLLWVSSRCFDLFLQIYAFKTRLPTFCSFEEIAYIALKRTIIKGYNLHAKSTYDQKGPMEASVPNVGVSFWPPNSWISLRLSFLPFLPLHLTGMRVRDIYHYTI